MQTLTEGIKQLVLDIPCIVLFSLFIAIILNQKIAGRALFRAIFFIPVIISTGIMAEIDAGNAFTNTMTSTSGMGAVGATSAQDKIVSAMDIEALFENMMIGTEITGYVTSLVNSIFDIINRCGVQMLIFLSALQSISPAIYESCSIDGASGWETFWKITLPMVSPQILVNTIYTVIDSFTAGDNEIMKYITEVNGKLNGDELSSAMAWMYFLIVIVLVAFVSLILGSFVFYSRRND